MWKRWKGSHRILKLRFLVLRKDKKGMKKNVFETNARLKNDCGQKKLDYIKNTNIKEYLA